MLKIEKEKHHTMQDGKRNRNGMVQSVSQYISADEAARSQCSWLSMIEIWMQDSEEESKWSVEYMKMKMIIRLKG